MMLLKICNVFVNGYLFRKTSANARLYYRMNDCNLKLRLFDKRYIVYNNRKLLKRDLLVSSCEIKPSNKVLLKESKRYFSSSEDEEIDFEAVDVLEEKLSSNIFRDYLYPNSDDPIIIKLKESSNVQNVFDIINEHSSEFNSEKCAQTLLVLWDFHRQCRSSDIYYEIYRPKNELFQTYMNEIKCHDTFTVLLNLLNKNYHDMSPDALACSILYLTRIGVDYKNNAIQNIILKIDSLLCDMKPGDFPVTALSRFVLSLSGVNRYTSELQWRLYFTRVIPHFEYWLKNCDNVLNFKLVTICIYAMNSVISPSLVEQYCNLTNNFIELNLFNDNIEDNVSAIIKAIMFFNTYHFLTNIPQKQLQSTISKLMNIMVKNVNKLEHFIQFFRLQKVFMYLREPAQLQDELKQCCGHWVENSDLNESDLSEVSPEMLFCLVVNTTPSKQFRFSEPALELVDKTSKLSDLFILSSSQLRSVVGLRKKIWPKLLNKLADCEYLRNIDTFIFCSFRYLDHFTEMRDVQFEHQLMEWMLSELQQTSAFYEPNKLSRCASFILSFPEYFQSNIRKSISLESFIQQLLNNMEQFKIIDCLFISRGFISVLSNYSDVSSQLMHHYAKLDAALTSRTLELFKELPIEDTSLNDLNMILRSYINRKGETDSYLFHKIVERFKHLSPSEISSRSLRNTTYNFYSMGLLVPDIMDKFCDYIVSNHDIVLGSTVSKLLYCAYILGFSPKNESFCNIACDIISRDVEKLSGLVLLHAAVALSSFNSLSDFLIRHIFTIEFLDQLDNEMKYGYSKIVYPARIRKCLMELNRSVCLDYPEANVPWFHAKFCQQEALGKKTQTSFYRNVYNTLLSIALDKRLIQSNVLSSYGHNIDFQVILDKSGNLVPYKKEKGDMDQNLRLAVILYCDYDYTIGVRRLKGPLQMQEKHLEMLGYKVIPIDQSLWNSMYMTEPKAKQNYLSSLIKLNSINKT